MNKTDAEIVQIDTIDVDIPEAEQTPVEVDAPEVEQPQDMSHAAVKVLEIDTVNTTNTSSERASHSSSPAVVPAQPANVLPEDGAVLPEDSASVLPEDSTLVPAKMSAPDTGGNGAALRAHTINRAPAHVDMHGVHRRGLERRRVERSPAVKRHTNRSENLRSLNPVSRSPAASTPNSHTPAPTSPPASRTPDPTSHPISRTPDTSPTPTSRIPTTQYKRDRGVRSRPRHGMRGHPTAGRTAGNRTPSQTGSQYYTQRDPLLRDVHNASARGHFGSARGSARSYTRGSAQIDNLPATKDTRTTVELLAAVAAITGLDVQQDLRPVILNGWLSGLRPARALLQADIITAKSAEQLLSTRAGYIAIEPMNITKEAAGMLPLWFCKQHNVVPVYLQDDILTVASPEMLKDLVRGELEEIAQCAVEYRLASHDSISACVAALSIRREAGEGVASLAGGQVNQSAARWRALIQQEEGDPAIANILVSLITRAVAMNASDIHIQTETTKDGSTVITTNIRRLGDLVSDGIHTLERGKKLINRLKVAGGFDVDPTTPCDGRYDIDIPGSGRYDLRLAGMPLDKGEMLVVRLLPQSRKGQEYLSDLYPERYTSIAQRVTELVEEPEGMILVVGSTGSGKSTTLAAMIRPLADNTKMKVVTVEDPVENLIMGAQQVRVTKRLTFGEVLRGFLRSDPDAILVGEIRDQDTAKMATQAAQTGHIVLSTLHASAVELTPGRLNEMGVPRSTLADVLLGVLSQKLVKTLCTYCSSGQPGRDPHPRGCDGCSHTGWGGRAAVAELMVVNPAVASLIAAGAPAGEIRAAAEMYEYSELASRLIDEGITTREAVYEQLGKSYNSAFEEGVYTDPEDFVREGFK